MTKTHQVTVNGTTFVARSGELLLDAALKNGVELPFDCRSGHCGTCCVRLISGTVNGGKGSEPGIVHACQCRIAGDAVVEKGQLAAARTVEGVLSSLQQLANDVLEVGITTKTTLPHHAGQYVKVKFDGYPSRPFSMSLPMQGDPQPRTVWFHMRRMPHGRVTSALGSKIKIGHRVSLTGPHGSAHFRPDHPGRMVLVATSTGFAPVWSIAVAALRENPERRMMLIAGGRSIESLYMGPALMQLARFPNVRVVPICSTPQSVTDAVLQGRPTDYLPPLLPTDVVYACGAASMVEAIKQMTAHYGAVCHADPFITSAGNDAGEKSSPKRAAVRLPVRASWQRAQAMQDYPMIEQG